MKSRFTKTVSLLLCCLFVCSAAVGCTESNVTDTTTEAVTTPETTGEAATAETTGIETETDPVTTEETVTSEETTTEEETTTVTETTTVEETTTEEETTVHTHSFSEWTVTKQPTCLEKGTEERKCTGCDETETRDVEATGHKFGGWTTVKKATCTEKGTEERVCSACGEKETRDVEATGHKFGGWTTVKKATCTEKGTEERVCSACGEKETRTIAAKGHTVVTDKAVKASCFKDGKTEGSHCSVCNAVLKAQEVVKAVGQHTYNGSWIITKAATETQDGEEARTCSVCGEKETRVLKYSDNVTQTPVILGMTMLAGNRVLVYGSTEPGSVMRTVINGSEMMNRSKDKYFYIELGIGGKSEISVYAQAAGKKESAAATVTADPSQLPGGGNVWGGRDSRLFYLPTLSFLTGNRANDYEKSTIKQLGNVIKNNTIKKIQSLTGKETKLIYVIIPDPATGHYQEHFDYVQNSVQDPSTSLMEAFISGINGIDKDVYAIDLMPTMRAHKDEFIYFSTDTHYTELGAYYAYLEIMKTVKKDYPNAKVRTVQNGDYNIVYRDVAGGDMCGMAGLGMNEVVPFFETNFSETGSYYVSKRKDGIKSAGFGPSGWQRDSSINSSNPTVYFLGDSYGCYILPFIGANFSKVWTNEGVLWKYEMDSNILSQNKPDYVILLICQRNVGGNFMGNLISQFSMSLG